MPISAALGSSALLPAGLGFRNKLINGDMRVAQRGTTVNGITSSDGCQTCDRWRINLTGAGTWNLTREADAPSGFYYSYKLYCSTGAGTITGSNYLQFEQRFEGQNLLDLGYGSSSPKPLTFSFWIKGNVTGTYVARLYSGTTSSGARSIHSTFTLDQSGVWEYKTVTFVGDSVGGRPVGETEGMRLTLWLAAGADFRTGSPNTSWATHASGTVSGSVNLASTTGNYVQFTGLQLEQNYQPTPFEQRPYGVELQLCQRYYQKSYSAATAPGTNTSEGAYYTPGVSYTSSSVDPGPTIRLSPSMRGLPTVTFYKTDGTSGWAGSYTSMGTPSSYNRGQNQFATYSTGGSGMPGGALGLVLIFHWTAEAEL